MIGGVIALVTVITTLVALALVESGVSQVKVSCASKEAQVQIQRLTERALDQAFQQHIALLFDVWMKNPNHEQLNRAKVGVQNGIAGYLRAQNDAAAWLPPTCPPPEAK